MKQIKVVFKYINPISQMHSELNLYLIELFKQKIKIFPKLNLS